MKMYPFIFFAAVCLLGCPNDDTPPIIVNTDVSQNNLSDLSTVDMKDEEMGSSFDIPGYGEVLWEGAVDINNSASPLLRFDVPENAISVHISVFGQANELYGLGRWLNGDDSVLVTPDWEDNDPGGPQLCILCPNRVTSSEASFGALAPNNETVSLVPGTHTISLIGYRQVGLNTQPLLERTVTVRVVAKLAPAEPTEGTLDINFYFTGALWDAESAKESASFQSVVQSIEGIYQTTGITMGEITYTDIGDEYQTVANVIAPGSEVQEMWSLSLENDRPAINVFLVKEIYALAGPGLGIILGLSGGIPGPNVTGTLRSGVVVAVDPAMAPPGTMNHAVIAHEIGHHLGLWHSSESSGNIHDQLMDTPVQDASNLMFHSGTGETLSPTQGRVMRLNPWVDTGER